MEMMESKPCNGCGEVKPDEDYRLRKMTRVSGETYHIRAKTCAECMNFRKRGRRPRLEKQPNKTPLELRLWTKFRLTLVEYEDLLIKQDNACSICKVNFETVEPKSIHIDHDHSCCADKGRACGKCVRGILCRECNIAMGFMKDNIENVRSMLVYLENWKDKSGNNTGISRRVFRQERT